MRAKSVDEDASSDEDFATGGTGSDGVELDNPTAEDSKLARINSDDVDLESDGAESGGIEPESCAAGGIGGRDCDIVFWLESSQVLAQLECLSLRSM